MYAETTGNCDMKIMWSVLNIISGVVVCGVAMLAVAVHATHAYSMWREFETMGVTFTNVPPHVANTYDPVLRLRAVGNAEWYFNVLVWCGIVIVVMNIVQCCIVMRKGSDQK